MTDVVDDVDTEETDEELAVDEAPAPAAGPPEVGLLSGTWADVPPPMPEPAPAMETGGEMPPPMAPEPAAKRRYNPLIKLGHLLSGGPNQS